MSTRCAYSQWVVMSILTPEGERIQVGPQSLQYVPLDKINVLPQVRGHIDQASVEALAMAIYTGQDGDEVTSDSFDLMHPPSVGFHTKESAKLYITEHGEFYEIPTRDRIDHQDLVPLTPDIASIKIAGHRRRLAMIVLAHMSGKTPADFSLLSSVSQDIPFDLALGKQVRENQHEPMSLEDTARATERFHGYLSRQLGRDPSDEDVASSLGIGERKVANALIYARLPREIQKLSESGELSYSNVLDLSKLYQLHLAEHGALRKDRREKAATDEVIAFVYKYLLENKMKGRVTQARREIIANRILEIESQAAYQELDGLLLDPEARTPYRRRKSASVSLAHTAMNALRIQSDLGDLSVRQLKELQQLTQHAVDLAELRRGRPIA